MWILLYVKVIWCSGIPYIYGQLEGRYICPKYMCILLYVESYSVKWYSIDLWSIGRRGGLGICAFCYMWNIFCGIAVCHRTLVNWMACTSASVCVHSAICWNLFGVVVFHRSMVNWRGYIWPWYMCILLYVWTYFGVVVFHRSMVNWRGYIWSWYLCSLLYVKLMWCSAIP